MTFANNVFISMTVENYVFISIIVVINYVTKDVPTDN